MRTTDALNQIISTTKGLINEKCDKDYIDTYMPKKYNVNNIRQVPDNILNSLQVGDIILCDDGQYNVIDGSYRDYFILVNYNGGTYNSGRNIRTIKYYYEIEEEDEWGDGGADETYTLPDYTFNDLKTTKPMYKNFTYEWKPKTGNGLTNFIGNYIGTDGDNIYLSNKTTSEQYVLDKATSTGIPKTWYGLTNFGGQHIWTDGENIYYSEGTTHYVLNKATSTWNTKTWTGLTEFNGRDIGTDGGGDVYGIYYSSGTTQYSLDKSTSRGSSKHGNGLKDFDGRNVWSDGEDIYYSNGVGNQYALEKKLSAHSDVGIKKDGPNIIGRNIGTDGKDIYGVVEVSGPAISGYFKFYKSISEGVSISFRNSGTFYGYNIGTDGDNIYYSFGDEQYVLTKNNIRTTRTKLDDYATKSYVDEAINNSITDSLGGNY